MEAAFPVTPPGPRRAARSRRRRGARQRISHAPANVTARVARFGTHRPKGSSAKSYKAYLMYLSI